ncbi:MAG: hypothetical protein ACE5ER_09820 [Nitrospinaceae bacterium]
MIEDTECANCKEIFSNDEMEEGLCESCWEKQFKEETMEEKK